MLAPNQRRARPRGGEGEGQACLAAGSRWRFKPPSPSPSALALNQAPPCHRRAQHLGSWAWPACSARLPGQPRESVIDVCFGGASLLGAGPHRSTPRNAGDPFFCDRRTVSAASSRSVAAGQQPNGTGTRIRRPFTARGIRGSLHSNSAAALRCPASTGLRAS